MFFSCGLVSHLVGHRAANSPEVIRIAHNFLVSLSIIRRYFVSDKSDALIPTQCVNLPNFLHRTDDVRGCSGSMLIQAIRSHIHFSQLSAWLSRSKGSIPSQITYRLVREFVIIN